MLLLSFSPSSLDYSLYLVEGPDLSLPPRTLVERALQVLVGLQIVEVTPHRQLQVRRVSIGLS